MEDKSFKKKVTLNFVFDQLQATSIIFIESLSCTVVTDGQ